jgi:hypothetical protein
MAQKAYIGLNKENCWTLYYGDGSEDERHVLAVGREFEPGKAIREAMEEIQIWARENGYEVDAPLYSTSELNLEDVIEPEIFDDIYGSSGA